MMRIWVIEYRVYRGRNWWIAGDRPWLSESPARLRAAELQHESLLKSRYRAVEYIRREEPSR